MHQLRLADKAAGVKRSPLHTLQECCEAAGVTPNWFGRWAAKYPGAPQPIFTTTGGAARLRRTYYRKADFVQWVNQIRQQIQAEKKGTIMPDLQSELSKVLNEWSEPEVNTQPKKSGRPAFQETTGTSRATSDYIRLNPGKTRLEIVNDLVSKGYKRATVYSLLVIMKRQNLITDDGGRLTANYTEYTPPKPMVTWRKLEAKNAKAQAKADRAAQRAESKPPKRKYTRRNAEAKAAAYEAHENYNPTAEPSVVAPPEFDAEAFVNGLTLKQAKAVYGELKKVFE